MFPKAPLRSEAGKHTGVTFIITSLCEARLIRDAEVRDRELYSSGNWNLKGILLRACVFCRNWVHGKTTCSLINAHRLLVREWDSRKSCSSQMMLKQNWIRWRQSWRWWNCRSLSCWRNRRSWTPGKKNSCRSWREPAARPSPLDPANLPNHHSANRTYSTMRSQVSLIHS